MIRWRQFSLRTIFLMVTVCALILLLWRNRPPPALHVRVSASGTAFVDDDEIERTLLSARIDREALLRKIWLMEPVMTLRAHPSASHQDVVAIIELAQRAGIEKFTLAIDDQDTAQ